jgi:cytochrome c-type biogenesis protein CcmH
MKKYLFILLTVIPYFAFALTAEERLKDDAQELRAHEVFRQIRCVVCAGESINDSKADIAKSLRMLVREKIEAGDSDEQVLAYVTARYGDAILMKPPFDSNTYILWVAPGLLLVTGFVLVIVFFRRASFRSKK